MIIPGKKPLFHKDGSQNAPLRIVALILGNLFLLFILRSINSGAIPPFFLPTLTPTRTFASYAAEGETNFTAGDLGKAIEAFQQALRVDPKNSDLWVELARIQIYSTKLIPIDAARQVRFDEAKRSIENALAISPDSSLAYAVRSFYLDWYATSALVVGDQKQALLSQGEQAAVRALQLDGKNTLALAYYAEVLIDQQKIDQANSNIKQALASDPSLMDVHRINGFLMESVGNYPQAIDEYKQALQIAPNLTFIYMSIGVNYRKILQYELALENFAKAATINTALGVKESGPYFSIANTYIQMGQFFSAGLNARKGLNYKPEDADAYAQLGMIYFKSRNYEGAIPAFKCALSGCTAQEACEVRQCDSATDAMPAIQGLPLTTSTGDYYITYGSDLAAMHTRSNNTCGEAMRILGLARQAFSTDEVAMNNIIESENICKSYGF
jgi:tetratricopeptide (TPR) repeat protein